MISRILQLVALSLCISTSIAEPTKVTVDGEVVNIIIEEHQAKRDVKLMFHIRLNERLTEGQLKQVFEGLRKTNPKPYDHYEYVFFKVLVGDGVYALADYSREKRKIDIMGPSNDEISILTSYPKFRIGESIVGAWIEKSLPQRLHIVKRNGQYFLISSYSTNRKGRSEDQIFIKRKGEFWKMDGDEEIIYKIDKNKNLSLISEGHTYFTAQEIKP